MNTKQENILVDSCQYTPVYLVENTGAIQGRSFILTQANDEEPKPVTDNLKRYYENSGILETAFVNNAPTFSKPRILKRQETKLIGNNLKLASFLMPKNCQEFTTNRQTTSVNHVQTTPVNTIQTAPVSNIQTVPVNKIQTVPVSNIQNVPINKIQNVAVSSIQTVPINKIQTVPVSTIQTLPVNNIQTVPVNNIQTVSVNKIQTVPVSNIQPVPVNKIQTLPVNNIHTVPVSKIHSVPVSNIHSVPVNNIQTVPVNNIQTAPVSNVVFKPVKTTSVVHTVPKVEVERKIVRLKNFPAKFKPTPRERVLPKTKPKDNPPNPNPIKHTSVQLLKLGETYHSLNQLSENQMKMVNQALKIFSNPENGTMEPTYDPVTNTRFIYKVVSPRDLTVVGKNKLKRENLIKAVKKEEITREVRREHKKRKDEDLEPPVNVAEKVKVTRSGRKVKFPKQIVKEIPVKPKKRNGAVVSCFQCSAEFCSLYRLQKHYESHPTHIPARIHSNLFHCLLAIIKSGSEEDKTKLFIEQLEQFIEKLKSLLPCLLKEIDEDEAKPCTINDNVGRLFGMDPGKYNLNMDALTCVKDKDGNCRHYPPPNINFDLDPASPICDAIDFEETANESETEDCARIKAVDKRAIANKRLKKIKEDQMQAMNAKRIKLASESADTIIELDDLIICNGNFSLPVEEIVDTVQPETIPLDNFIDADSENCIQKPVVVTDTPNATINSLPSDTLHNTALIKNKHPVLNKRLKNEKQHKTQEVNAKKGKPKSDNTETTMKLDDLVICNDSFNIPMQPNTDDVESEAISLLDNFIDNKSDYSIQQPVVYLKDTQKSATCPDLPRKAKGAQKQFHSAHFDIRSSPIKTSSAATFRRFQINPGQLPKYEVQIFRPLELDASPEEVNPNPKVDITNQSETEVQSSPAVIEEDSVISTNSDNSVLQSIFRDDLIELTCKDPNDIPNDLDFAAAKEWISSGLGEKSSDGFLKTNSLDESFIRGNSLIEPALLHCKEDSNDKLLVLGNEMTAAEHLSGNDNHLLNQGSASVLNFLDSLGSECLSYPETEIRNNNVDFQLDLFSFSNT